MSQLQNIIEKSLLGLLFFLFLKTNSFGLGSSYPLNWVPEFVCGHFWKFLDAKKKNQREGCCIRQHRSCCLKSIRCIPPDHNYSWQQKEHLCVSVQIYFMAFRSSCLCQRAAVLGPSRTTERCYLIGTLSWSKDEDKYNELQIGIYNSFKGGCSEVEFGLFCQVPRNWTRRKGLKWHQTRFRLDIIRNFFTEAVDKQRAAQGRGGFTIPGMFKYCEDVDMV